MMVMLVACREQTELKTIYLCSRECAAYNSDEKWEYHLFSEEKKLEEFIGHLPNLDLACMDAELPGGLEKIRGVREKDKTAYLILIANPERSPVTYLRPDIMAGSLLLHPVEEKEAMRVLKEAMRSYMEKFEENDGNTFSIDTREGRWKIPWCRIQYFEAREKKLFLHMEEREIAFYDTLDHIQNETEGRFLRCHRSFLVNVEWIEKVQIGQNRIWLENGAEIPVSRTFRQAVKEYLK